MRFETTSINDSTARQQQKKRVPILMTRRRREKCRQNQAQYRQRQNDYLFSLKEDVGQLREDVASLQIQREVVARGVPMRSSVWNVAVEFFRIFHTGHTAPVMLREFVGTNEPYEYSLYESSVQLNFLRATMTPDVTDGTDSTVCGVDALMEKCKLFSLYHGNVVIGLECVERAPHDSVIATTTTSMIITEETLRLAFPHLLRDQHSSCRYLASRLLGCNISMRGSMRFDWDDAQGRVKRVTGSSDMMTPMLKLLGNAQDVAIVFNQALISPDDIIVGQVV